jgi:hypothetical protein
LIDTQKEKVGEEEENLDSNYINCFPPNTLNFLIEQERFRERQFNNNGDINIYNLKFTHLIQGNVGIDYFIPIERENSALFSST